MYLMRCSETFILSPPDGVQQARQNWDGWWEAEVENGFRAMRLALRGIGTAVPEFQRSIATMRKLADSAGQGATYSEHYEAPAISALLMLQEAKQRLERFLGPEIKRPEHGRNWPACAEMLSLLFREVMSSANPGKRYGVSADGPAVRFIQRGLALVRPGSSTPTREAIKQALGRTSTKTRGAALFRNKTAALICTGTGNIGTDY